MKCSFSSSRFPAVVLCLCLFGYCPIAWGGGVVKIDESAINGEIVSFDGTNVTIQTGITNGVPQRQVVPLDELMRVRIAGGPATIAIPRMNPQPAVAPTSPQVNLPTGRAGARGQAVAVAPARGRSSSIVPPLQPQQGPQPLSLPPNWQLRSSGGDQIEGRIRSWTQDQVSFEFGPARMQFDVPTAKVSEIWRAAPDLIRRARDLNADSTDEDVAYVVRDTDIVAVKGVALGIEGDSLKFRYAGEERKISVQKLLGVVLVPQKNAASNDAAYGEFHQSFQLASGTILGHWKRLENDLLTIETLLGPVVQLPSNAVPMIENRNGRVAYLSDMIPVKVEQTPYFDRMMSYRNDSGLSGGPLRLTDGEAQHGIAVHSRTVLEYDLGSSFDRFLGRVGFEYGVGAAGRVAVRVLADEKPLFSNPDLHGDQKPVDLDLDVHGANRLTLEVDFGADEDVADRVIWAGARIVRPGVKR